MYDKEIYFDLKLIDLSIWDWFSSYFSVTGKHFWWKTSQDVILYCIKPNLKHKKKLSNSIKQPDLIYKVW